MKRMYLLGCIAVFFSIATSSAQVAVPVNQHPVEKPALFSQLPDKFSCSEAALQNLFKSSVNSQLSSVQLNDQLPVSGTVLEKVIVTKVQTSINIRCANYHDALLNISRITQPDGSIKFTGRIVHPAYGDVLLLTGDKGQYYFVKQRQLLSMVE
jgi:hypothetical protein